MKNKIIIKDLSNPEKEKQIFPNEAVISFETEKADFRVQFSETGIYIRKVGKKHADAHQILIQPVVSNAICLK